MKSVVRKRRKDNVIQRYHVGKKNDKKDKKSNWEKTNIGFKKTEYYSPKYSVTTEIVKGYDAGNKKKVYAFRNKDLVVDKEFKTFKDADKFIQEYKKKH